ncbi:MULTISPECIES: hypothetical protein [Okeania]|uniref:hypothetical protein n=1 Tax=Okeania TaxID=1458928 RepID=UPI001374C447|nr:MULTISPECIES: hypothetical protein [Okeania]NES89241.1 hypothetical protein [Okeania sp. SIO2B9]
MSIPGRRRSLLSLDNQITITLGFFDLSIPRRRRSLFSLHLKTLVQQMNKTSIQ